MGGKSGSALSSLCRRPVSKGLRVRQRYCFCVLPLGNGGCEEGDREVRTDSRMLVCVPKETENSRQSN